MERKLLMLSSNNDTDELAKAVKAISNDEILSMVERILSTEEHNLMKLLMALFKGIQSSSNSSPLKLSQMSSMDTKKTFLFKGCVDMLTKKDLSIKMSTDIVRLLSAEMDALPSWFLVKLAKDITEYLRNTETKSFRFLEILPKLLHLIQSHNSISVDSGMVDGKEFQNSIMQGICLIKWNSSSIVHLASVFKEIHLSLEELHSVVEKCLKAMDTMDMHEIPPLVYQLLILSSKGCKSLVLDGIIKFFTKHGSNVPGTMFDDMDMIEDSTPSQSQRANAPSRLQQIEGTVIYHVTFSIKQDQELGKEFLKYLKAYQHSGRREMLSSFIINLALSISKISSFESQVLDLLKQVVMYCFKDQRKKFESKWLRENSDPPFDVAGHMLHSIKQMLVEWDVVMEGLVAFGFSLMEVPQSKGCFGRPALNQGCNESSPIFNLNSLGTKILEECSKVHTNVAIEIVNQLSNRIITKDRDYALPCHYGDLLIFLLKSSPHTYVENCSKFKDLFDYFSFLPLGTSRVLLSALLPVVRISPVLKNGLMLFLRKSLFSRHLEMKKVAVTGFLLLLKNFKVLIGLSNSQSQGSSSQIQADVHRNNNIDVDNKSLCLEIVGSLRRCFGQQLEIKSLLYDGLRDVSIRNPVLLGPITDLFLTQLKNYFDPNDSNLPPLKMMNCISLNQEVWIAIEPLPDLIRNIIHCLEHLKVQKSSDEKEREFLQKADSMLISIETRLVNCDLDDFELDQEGEFDMSTMAGSKNLVLAQLIVGVYEVFLQRAIMTQDVSQERVETMLKLFEGLNKIVEAGKNGEPNKKGEGARRGKPKKDVQKPSSLVSGRYLSLDFVVKVTKMMIEQEDGISNLILLDSNFCNYLFNSTIMLLQQLMAASPWSDDSELRFCFYALEDQDRIVNDLSYLGRMLLKRYIKMVIKPHNNDISIAPTATNNANKVQTNASKAVNLNCLKVFHQILSFISKKWSNKITEFLLSLNVVNKNIKKIIEKNAAEGLVQYIKMFQRIFYTLLTSAGETFSPKDRLVIMQCLVLMIDNCTREEVLADCCDWLTRLFKEHVIDDSELLKVMIKQLFILLRRTDLSLNFLKDVCRDIHLCMGDINQEVELDTDSSNLPTVNHRSSVVIIQSLLTHLEVEIEDSEWLIVQMKSQFTPVNFTSEDDDANESEKASHCDKDVVKRQLLIKQANKNLIDRTSSMTDVFHELIQTSVPFGPSVEMVFKVLNKFYALLCSFVKLYNLKYTQKNQEIDIVVAGPFEKLIKHTATHLTKFVYPMISHVEKVEIEKLQAENEKYKNKKNKKKNIPNEKIKKMRETRLIPSLILNVEQYERLLIQLSKKSKVNLMAHFKVSTARDFRINNAALQGILEERRSEGFYGSDEDGDDNPGNESRGSRTTGAAAENDDVEDVEAEIASLLRDGENDENGGDDETESQDEDETARASAPRRKRAKLEDVLPGKKDVADRKKVSRKKK